MMQLMQLMQLTLCRMMELALLTLCFMMALALWLIALCLSSCTRCRLRASGYKFSKSKAPRAFHSKHTRALTFENLYKGNVHLGVGTTQQAQVLVDMSQADDCVLRELGPPLSVYMYL
jgi:hypothetical protein